MPAVLTRDEKDEDKKQSDKDDTAEKDPPFSHGEETGFEDPSAFATLRFELAESWQVHELATFLSQLRVAYACLDRVLDPTLPPQQLARLVRMAQGESDPTPFGVGRYLQKQELVLSSIHMDSPGWAAVFGKLNPFTVIRDYLILFRDWKSTREKHRLENEKLRLHNEKAQEENAQLIATNKHKLEALEKTAELDLEAKHLKNEALRLETDKLRLQNEAKEIANQHAEAKMYFDGEKVNLDLQLKDNKLITERVKLLRQAKVPTEEIKDFVETTILKPLHSLSSFVDSGKVKAITVESGAA